MLCEICEMDLLPFSNEAICFVIHADITLTGYAAVVQKEVSSIF